MRTHWSLLEHVKPVKWKGISRVGFCGLLAARHHLTGVKAKVDCLRCLHLMRLHGHMEVAS